LLQDLLLSGNSTIGPTGQSIAAEKETLISVPATLLAKLYRLRKRSARDPFPSGPQTKTSNQNKP
jgi:hypothetical protein